MQRSVFYARRLVQALGLLTLLLLLSGWSLPVAAKDTNMAFIRLVHASPDIGVVAVFVDGQQMMDGNQVLASFQFASVTEYAPLPAGSHTIQIAALGQGANAAMLSRTLTLQPNTAYTVAVIGTKASDISFQVFTDDNGVIGNMAKFRFYHLSPDMAFIDITTNGQKVVQNLAYPRASTYVPLPTGTHTFMLTAAGQQGNESFSATLNPWTVTSIFAIGQINGPKKLQFVTSQAPGMPNMPNTGSDPSVPSSGPEGSRAPMWWLLGLLLVVGIGSGMWCARRSVWR